MDVVADGQKNQQLFGVNYSVFLTPPMIAGLQSFAHLMILDRILLTPVSFGFSSPLITLCFITLTNSLLLSFPSPSLSKRVKTLVEIIILLSWNTLGQSYHINEMIRQIHMSHSFSHMFHGGSFNRSPGNVVELQRCVDLVDGIQNLRKSSL